MTWGAVDGRLQACHHRRPLTHQQRCVSTPKQGLGFGGLWTSGFCRATVNRPGGKPATGFIPGQSAGESGPPLSGSSLAELDGPPKRQEEHYGPPTAVQ